MGKYVKSYSNYLLKTKHQDINGGTIYERDITTIGGRDRFAKGQVPIYKSGNFVITVNNDNTAYKKTPTQEWKGNDEGDVWTLDILKNYEKDEKSSDDRKIVIKKDYYDLRDFAYYGSCAELIRVSINNILETFPGELFVPVIDTWIIDDNVFYSEAVAQAYLDGKGSSDSPSKYKKESTISVTYTDTKMGADGVIPPVKRTFKLPDVIYDAEKGSNYSLELFAIDNPFGIDIHSEKVPDGADPLKYFADGGTENYVGFGKVNGEWDFDTELKVSVGKFFKYIDKIFVTTTVNDSDEIVIDEECAINQEYCPGDYMGYITLTVGSCSTKVYVFLGDNGEAKYFVGYKIKKKNQTSAGDGNCLLNYRIRPKYKIIERYYKSLNNFEQILLNRGTNYESTFEIIKESDYGFYVETQRYIFPTTYGGYNLGSTGSTFSEYVEALVKIGEYYDERYTDNLWRSMTHEAIKNFDWTYTRHYNPGDESDYIEGGNKIQKIIRIYGREFDETRSYIDAISDNNTITYDNINNLPDYFFSDKLEDDGWDVKLVNPFDLKEYIYNTDGTKTDVTESTTKADEIANTYNGKHLERVFTEDYGVTSVKPYTKYNITSLREDPKCMKWINGKLVSTNCVPGEDMTVSASFETESALINAIDLEVESNTGSCCDGNTMDLQPKTGEFQRDGYHDDCCHDIKIYSSEKEYTTAEVNSEFLKRFILNSRYILRHKGTIEGIEMLLGLFGLKSKDYVFSNDTYFQVANDNEIELTKLGEKYYKKIDLTTALAYDYDIKEYTLFTKRFDDKYDNTVNMYHMDWINSLKLSSYNTPEYRKGQYVSYQGLPVSYRLKNEPTTSDPNPDRYIYPSFQNYYSYDGGLYYQMNGGWLSKNPFIFDVNNNIVPVDYTSDNGKNSMLFTETVKNIKCVQTLDELLSNRSLATTTGEICQVIDLSGRYAVVDGTVYKLLKDESGFDFFYVTSENNSLTVGNAYFTDFVYISNPYGENQKLRINLADETYNGKSLKVYVINGTIDVHSNSNSISTFTLFENGKYMEGNNFTNYFRINNPDFSNELSVMGWQQLKDNEYEYYLMETVIDYDKGNNPHTGHMNYDKGHEYLAHFNKLFKTVYENSLFDTSIAPDVDLYSESYTYGFDNLIDEDECIKNYDRYLQEDIKCHYFGDYFDTSGHVTKYGLDNKNYMTGTIRKTILGYGKLQQLHYADNVSDKTNVDGVTNQIVNTKRVDIDFFLNAENEYSTEWLEEVKYIDAVILPYLTQIVPSTIILTVNYRKKSEKVCTPST